MFTAVSVILAFGSLAVASAAEMCSTDESCQACAETQDSNGIATIPRFANNGPTSPYLGSYRWFDCDSGTCTPTITQIPQDPSSTPADHPMAWVAGVLSVFAILFLLGIIAISCGLTTCTMRYCCCCCRSICKRNCSICLCGDKYPTQKKRAISCGGFQMNNRSAKFEYSFLERNGARACTCGLLITLVAIAIAGTISGNFALSEATLPVLRMPYTSIDVLRWTLTPMAELLENVASDGFPRTLVSLGSLINRTIDIPFTVDNIECTVDAFNDAIPNITVIGANFDELEDHLDDILSAVGGVGDAIEDVHEGVLVVKDRVSDMNDTLRSVKSTLREATRRLETLDASMADMSADLDEIGSEDGIVSSIDNDMEQTQDNYPSSDELSDASDGSNYFATMASTEGDSDATREGHYESMQLVLQTLDGLPDYNATAESMLAFNELVDIMTADDGHIVTLIAALNATNITLQGLPKSELITDDVDAIFTAVDAIPIDGVGYVINNITELLDTFPSLAPSIRELRGVLSLTDTMIPCLRNVTEQILNVNKTMIEIPAAIADMLNVDDMLNGTFASIFDLVNSTIIQLQSATDAVTGTNMTEVLQQVEDAKASIQDSKTQINTTDIVNQMEAMSSARLSLEVVNDLEALNASLVEAIISETDIEAMRTLNDTITNVTTTLAHDLELLRIYVYDTKDIVCENDVNVDCSVNGDSDCDSGVGPGEECVDDAGRMATLTGLFSVLDEARPDVSGIRAGLGAAITQADAVDLESVNAELANANASILAVDINAFQTQLAGVNDQLDSVVDGPLASVNGTVFDLIGTIEDVNFTSYREQLDEMGDMLESFKELLLDMLLSFKPLMLSIYDVITIHTPRYVERLQYERIRSDRLEPVEDGSNAPGDVLSIAFAVTRVVDNMTGIVAPTVPEMFLEMFGLGGGNSSNETETLAGTNLTGTLLDMEDELEITEMISYDDFYDPGQLYYVYAIVSKMTNMSFISHEDSSANTVAADSSGSPYKDSALCLTDACLVAQNEAIHRGPITDVAGKGAAPVPVDIPLNREHLFAIISFLGLFVIVLLGLCAILVPMCMCTGREQGKSAAWCPCCFTISVWTATPVFLIIGGFMLMPIVLFGDVCAGVEDVGLQYIATAGDELCTDTLNGNGTLDECFITQALPPLFPAGDDDDDSSSASNSTNSTSSSSDPEVDLRIRLDLKGMVTGLLVGCEGSSDDPYVRMFNSMGNSLYDVIPNTLDPALEGMAEPLGVRDPLMNIGFNLTASFGNYSQILASSMGDYVDCDAVHSIYSSFKDPVCCGVLDSMYWLALPIVLIGLILCFAGLFISCYARKRLGASPWGPDWENADRASAPESGSGRGNFGIRSPAPTTAAAARIRGQNPAFPRSRKVR